jgi:hypothetical protein
MPSEQVLLNDMLFYEPNNPGSLEMECSADREESAWQNDCKRSFYQV